jgi:hypothetical protein
MGKTVEQDFQIAPAPRCPSDDHKVVVDVIAGELWGSQSGNMSRFDPDVSDYRG